MRLFCLLFLPVPVFAQGLAVTYAGSDFSLPINGLPAATAYLSAGKWGKPAIDTNGNVFFALTARHVVLRLTSAGTVEVFAGSGLRGFSGDGGQAIRASLDSPASVAVDSKGVVYIADTGNRRVRRVLPSGIVETFAGGGAATPTTLGVGLLQSALPSPASLAVDAVDAVYTNIDRLSIVRLDPDSRLARLIAGTPGRPGPLQAGDATQALFRDIAALDSDRQGNLFVCDPLAQAVARIDAAGRLTIPGAASGSITGPVDIVAGTGGQFFIVQNFASAIWRIAASGQTAVFAGSAASEGIAAVGAAGEAARFGNDLRIGRDVAGGLLVADARNNRLIRLDQSGRVVALIGAPIAYAGEGAAAAGALLASPAYLAQGRAGSTFISDPALRAVFSVDRSGIFRRFAGNGLLNAPFREGSPALDAAFGTPFGLALDPSGNVYIADDDCSIRRVGTDNLMRVFAGAPNVCGNSPDGRTALSARFGRLRGLAIDAAGNLLATDISNHKLWEISANGIVRTLAGTGEAGAGPANSPGTSIALNSPEGVASAGGSIFLADSGNHRVLRSSASGPFSLLAGTGQRASNGDNAPASSAALFYPLGIAADASGNVYISERDSHVIRRVAAAGTITTFAGTRRAGFSGDGGPAIAAALDLPSGLLLDPAGNLLVADRNNARIRAVLASPPSVRFSSAAVQVTTAIGDTAADGQIELTSPFPGIAFSVSVRVSGPATSWMRVSPERGSLPATLSYTIAASALAPGDYQADIVVATPDAAPRQTIIPVSLRVSAAGPPGLGLSVNRLVLTAVSGGRAQQLVPIRNTGPSPVSVRASTSTSFLAVEPDSLLLASGESASFAVNAESQGLEPGTYFSTLTLQSGEIRTAIPVSFTVALQRTRMIVSQTGLTFRAVQNGPAPPPQPLSVLAAGAGTLNWGLRAATVSAPNWLRVSVLDGSSTPGEPDPPRILVSVDPAGLPPQDYYGRIELFDKNNPAITQALTVLLQLLPAGADPGPALSPTGLVFAALPGAEAAAQDVMLSLPVNALRTFTSGALTFDGRPWLRYFPSAGIAQGAAPARISVQPDLRGLAPGVYRGGITILLEDGQVRTISVIAVVGNGGDAEARGKLRQSSSCTSNNLLVQVLSPPPNFRVSTGEPVRISAKVIDACGFLHQPESAATAGVSVVGAAPQAIPLNHVGRGVWESTWTPAQGLSSATLIFFALFSRGTTVQTGAEKVSGSASSAPRPVLFPNSLTDAASFQSGAPVAPGSLVTLFGANLSDSAGAASAPYPSKLAGVEVRLNQRPVPLLFAGSTQINAQIPYDLLPGGVYPLEIETGGRLTTPQLIVLARASPGVFTVDQSGTGQAHAYITRPSGPPTLAAPATPASAGDALVIYANGLGFTTLDLPAGEPAPLDRLAPVIDPVRVTIGGREASVLFAGLVPGFVGLFQVNALVPAGISPGPDVVLQLQTAGQISQPVTISVR